MGENGTKRLGDSQFATRPNNPADYNSGTFRHNIRAAVGESCRLAGVSLADLGALGVSWPGAVLNGKAATSKTILDMRDVRCGVCPNRELLTEVRNLGPFLRETLGLEREVAVVVGGFSSALALARASDYVATVPERHTGTLRAGMYSFALPFVMKEFTVSLLWHPRLEADPVHRWLRQCVQEACAEQRRGGKRR